MYTTSPGSSLPVSLQLLSQCGHSGCTEGPGDRTHPARPVLRAPDVEGALASSRVTGRSGRCRGSVPVVNCAIS